MSFESTLPDAASVVGNTPGFSTAVASLWGPARAQATGVTSGSAGDVGNAVWLKGKGYRRITGYDNSGQPIYRHLDPTERARPEFRDEDTKLANELAHQREGRLAARDSQIRAEDRRRWEAQQGLQQGQLNLQGQQIQAGIDQARVQAGLEGQKIGLLGQQIKEQGLAAQRAHELNLQQLTQSSDQFTRTLAYKALSESQDRALTRQQIEDNTELAKEKMRIESSQFDRQMAQDDRTSRRARVINSLSIVAQSLARL